MRLLSLIKISTYFLITTIPYWFLGVIGRGCIGFLSDQYDSSRELSIRQKVVSDLTHDYPEYHETLTIFDHSEYPYDSYSHMQMRLHQALQDPCSHVLDHEEQTSVLIGKHLPSCMLRDLVVPFDTNGEPLNKPLNNKDFKFIDLLSAARTTAFSKNIDTLCEQKPLSRTYVSKYIQYKSEKPAFFELANISNTTLWKISGITAAMVMLKRQRNLKPRDPIFNQLGVRRTAAKMGWRPSARAIK